MFPAAYRPERLKRNGICDNHNLTSSDSSTRSFVIRPCSTVFVIPENTKQVRFILRQMDQLSPRKLFIENEV